MIAVTKELKLWLVLILIFLLGVATGISLSLGLASHNVHTTGPQQIKSRMLTGLTHRLKLTPDQQAKIQPIMADAATQIQALRRDEAGRISQVIEKMNGQMAAILTPEQQAELQRMEKEMQNQREQMFPGHMRPRGDHDGPGGPPHGGEDGDMSSPPPPPGPASAPPNH